MGAGPAALRGIRLSRRAQPVERCLEDGLEVAAVAVDLSNNDDHVQDLLEDQAFTDFVTALGGDEEWPAGVDPPGPTFAEYGVPAVDVGQQLNVADNMWTHGSTALDAAFRRR